MGNSRGGLNSSSLRTRTLADSFRRISPFDSMKRGESLIIEPSACGSARSYSRGCRLRPVPEARAQLLHPFDATNTGSQIGAEKTAVGCFVGEPAHGAKTKIDGAGGELTGFETRAITQDHDPVEGQARLRAIPVNELIDGVSIRVNNPALRRLSRGCSTRRPWRVPSRANVGRIWCYCAFFANLASAS